MATKLNSDFVHDSYGDLGLEASDAGLAPGVWPEEVEVKEVIYTRKGPDYYGNMFYMGPNNQLLVIFND